eukprot:TRINITY_DN10829_c0_g3_i1.p1 TRINITY_DN10829_c0_g3~~TRINITY_DN10829_c0_g3_i1.p1  ORF type:complete len:555 (+),score=130.10 TRINITY_DN10829_c0_g3_i1:65-1729(+)
MDPESVLADPKLLCAFEAAATGLHKDRPRDVARWLADFFADVAGPRAVSTPDAITAEWFTLALRAGYLQRLRGEAPNEDHGEGPKVRGVTVAPIGTSGRAFRVVADHDSWGQLPRSFVVKLRPVDSGGVLARRLRRLEEWDRDVRRLCRVACPRVFWTGAVGDGAAFGQQGPQLCNVLEEDLGGGSAELRYGAVVQGLAALHAPFLRNADLLPSAWQPVARHPRCPPGVEPLWCWMEPGGIFGPALPPADPRHWAPAEDASLLAALHDRLPGLMGKRRYRSMQSLLHGCVCDGNVLPVDAGGTSAPAFLNWEHAHVGNIAADLAHYAVLQTQRFWADREGPRGDCVAVTASAAAAEAVPWAVDWRDLLRRYRAALSREGASCDAADLEHCFAVAAAATLLWVIGQQCRRLFRDWGPAVGDDAARLWSEGSEDLLRALEEYAVPAHSVDGMHVLDGVAVCGVQPDEAAVDVRDRGEAIDAMKGGHWAAVTLLQSKDHSGFRAHFTSSALAFELVPGACVVAVDEPAPDLRLVFAGRLAEIRSLCNTLRSIAAQLQ